LRFLGIILKVLRLEVSAYKGYITKQFQATFAGEGGGGDQLVEVTVNSKDEKSQDFFLIRPLGRLFALLLDQKNREVISPV
jgi:hypothetical protein